MYNWDWLTFLQVILSLLSLTFIVVGALTTYFGSGKSRAAGISILIVGIILPIIMYFAWWRPNGSGYFTNSILLPGLLYIGGGIIGVAIGFGVFLGIIMKT